MRARICRSASGTIMRQSSNGWKPIALGTWDAAIRKRLHEWPGQWSTPRAPLPAPLPLPLPQPLPAPLPAPLPLPLPLPPPHAPRHVGVVLTLALAPEAAPPDASSEGPGHRLDLSPGRVFMVPSPRDTRPRQLGSPRALGLAVRSATTSGIPPLVESHATGLFSSRRSPGRGCRCIVNELWSEAPSDL
jgi:hypothetical protein